LRLRLKAPAKVNLVLEVLGRRPDGFHEIRSVVQQITLFDRLEAQLASTLSLEPPLPSVASDENLVLRAAKLLQERAKRTDGAQLRLAKGIPVGAGLGGGSSDAAAALRLLSQLWKLEPGHMDLPMLASQLGSDVPLFLTAGASLLSGRGEVVQPVPGLRGGWFVIVAPPWREARKTALVYSAVQPEDFGNGRASQAATERLLDGGGFDADLLLNGLEPAARRVFPSLAAFQRELTLQSGHQFVLAGAGPALFSYVADRGSALGLARRLSLVAPDCLLAQPLNRLCPIRG
jgi:4-diphosphocytidyl-2-C-methyl-D-erythritol kinase